MEIRLPVPRRGIISASHPSLFREVAHDHWLEQSHPEFQQHREETPDSRSDFLARTHFLAAGADIDFLRARLQECNEQSNRQRGAHPDDGMALKSFPEFERKIEFVAQPAACLARPARANGRSSAATLRVFRLIQIFQPFSILF